MTLSPRAVVTTARTYNRPLEGGAIETWEQTIDRVIMHQRWLWERAQGSPLKRAQEEELSALRGYMIDRKVLPAGRTLWLGGTELSTRRELTQFNCSYLKLQTINDVVDHMWLLLNGAGVGFSMEKGILNGFSQYIPEVEVIRSERTEKGGAEHNTETWDADKKIWTIQIGDSGEAWAKALGKLLSGKYPAKKLVFDLSQIRPAGGVLSQYGWISAGDEVIAQVLPRIAAMLNRRAGQLLSKIDILDLGNYMGQIQTGRRGAEIALLEYGDKEWKDFARAKDRYWETGNMQREQSNNSLVFYRKPSRGELNELMSIMTESGGSEPGVINGNAALNRAPYYKGNNPCNEVLLGNYSFCNLVETDIAAFKDDPNSMHKAHWLVARANYRQTCVDLDDGVLQRAWHENNEFLRLCGAGLTGIVRRPDMGPYDFKRLRNTAITGAYSMAEELKMPLPKNVTTVKPSGTVGKIMDTTEGIHRPIGKYIFNNITFSKHHPLVPMLEKAGYNVFSHPTQSDAVLVTFPVKYEDVEFDIDESGKAVNKESALDQLNRYKMLMDNYVDHNCSITVSYGEDEIEDIVDWLDGNWDSYVGVSFLPRTDPSKTAQDLGYPYLPQEVRFQEDWERYALNLDEVDPYKVVNDDSVEEMLDADCQGGACPVR